MKSGESVSDYFSRTMAIANKMRIHGDKMADVTIIEKILRSMTAKFNYVVCSIEESKDTDSMSIDELQSSLLVHEQKMNRQDKKEQALQASASKGGGQGRGRGRGRGGNDGRHSNQKFEDFDSQGRGKGHDKNNNNHSTPSKSKSADKSRVDATVGEPIPTSFDGEDGDQANQPQQHLAPAMDAFENPKMELL
ncbi:hypothetical protein F0562_001993 [Nyssa sinensis]|uniref:Uncharacterized protein n=1 Tax=Nyssa sinensis TaxID=561372 RepID=A0A5J5C574_9ASTE|nr:hypothetical protein F0562_001993 [Nyssa sinensis]